MGVSSYQVPLARMGPPDKVAAACAAFSTERGLNLLVLMPSFDDPSRGGAFTRQLAFFSSSTAGGGGGAGDLLPGLVEAIGPLVGGLTPAPEVDGPLAATAFYVGDPKASRKKIQPLLLEHLSREGIAKK